MRDDLVSKGSWHDQYSGSPYIYIGNLPKDLTKGDLRTIFAQYGEVVDVNLVCDRETGASRGFAFLAYANQKSTVLAVDNFNGIDILGRKIRVDHVLDYKAPEERQAEKAGSSSSRKEKYAQMVTEDLFSDVFASLKSSAQPAAEVNPDQEAAATSAIDDGASEASKTKRRRTREESELRDKFLRGTLSETEYLEEKKKLKMALKAKRLT